MPVSLKELKKMWKQYMKTPFSGQPPTHEHHPAGSPKRERGLLRVASLPTVKTPSAATAGWGDPMRGVNVSLLPQQQQQEANTQYGGHPSYSRTHNHTDDLRSYEPMSKLYSRAGLHSRFTSRLGVVATLHRLILLQQPPCRHRRVKVIGRAPQEAVAVVTGV